MALYVVVHGSQRMKRGKNPSETFNSERNPRKAFQNALAEIRDYYPQIGGYIPRDIIEMTAVSNVIGQTITGDFNGIEITATPASCGLKLAEKWTLEMERRREEYENSSAYKEHLKEMQMKAAANKEKVYSLINDLAELDYTNFEAILDWLVSLEKVADDRDPSVNLTVVAKTFIDKGFEIDANLHEKFNGEDAENYARYLIGQALHNLNENKNIHQVIDYFTEEWKKKFIGNSIIEN